MTTQHHPHHHPHQPHPHEVTVHINRKEYAFDNPVQTGRSLKERAQIPLTDVLYLQKEPKDEIIANDATIYLKPGEHFHSQPPADYGDDTHEGPWATGLPNRSTRVPQPEGWTFLIIEDFELPDGYMPTRVRLLIKVPPLFPQAQPDMFWTSPVVSVVPGAVPRGTSMEILLGQNWQRFSWHLMPGAWNPSISTMRDFVRCIRARFERKD